MLKVIHGSESTHSSARLQVYIFRSNWVFKVCRKRDIMSLDCQKYQEPRTWMSCKKLDGDWIKRSIFGLITPPRRHTLAELLSNGCFPNNGRHHWAIESSHSLSSKSILGFIGLPLLTSGKRVYNSSVINIDRRPYEYTDIYLAVSYYPNGRENALNTWITLASLKWWVICTTKRLAIVFLNFSKQQLSGMQIEEMKMECHQCITPRVVEMSRLFDY